MRQLLAARALGADGLLQAWLALAGDALERGEADLVIDCLGRGGQQAGGGGLEYLRTLCLATCPGRAPAAAPARPGPGADGGGGGEDGGAAADRDAFARSGLYVESPAELRALARATPGSLRAAPAHGKPRVPFLTGLLPLLRLLSHPAIALSPMSHATNPAFAAVFQHLGHDAVAGALREMLAAADAGGADAPFSRGGDGGGGGGRGGDGAAAAPAGPAGGAAAEAAALWVPADWADVLHPLTTYLSHALQRFQGDWARAGPSVLALWRAAREAFLKRVAAPRAGGALDARARRLLATMEALEGQLGVAERGSRIMDEALEATRAARAAAASGARRAAAPAPVGDANWLPGELRPAGPRHDNDKASVQDIRAAPTAAEVLCKDPPYLPPNRPGGVLHVPPGDVNRAHRELHFRLLRHDLVGEIAAAVQALQRMGGVAALPKAEGSLVLKLDSGSLPVSFDVPRRLQRSDRSERLRWWDRTRQLGHGALVALWIEGRGARGAPPPQPALLFGVVCQRDVQQLAPAGNGRPRLGIMLCGDPFDERLLDACMGAQLGGGSEVILLQASASFFAYEPILKARARRPAQRCTALQSSAPIPLAHALLPGADGDAASARQRVEPPAFAAEPGTLYDLSPVLDGDRSQGLTEAQLASLRAFDPARPESFPLDALLAGSTFDAAQARALRAALTQEVVLVQGPPGTGKTYLGTQLVRLLLGNTRNSRPGIRGALAAAGRAPPAAAPPAGPRREAAAPDVGPLLVVTYTNHALDDFLERLLDAGVTEIARVGGRSRSERLAPFNLRELQSKSRAGGAHVSGLLGAVKESTDELQALVGQRKRERDACLLWGDVSTQLRIEAPRLYASFEARRELLQAAAAAAAAAGDDGWQQAGPRRPRDAAAAAAAAGDVLQLWLRGDPVSDWRQEQESRIAEEMIQSALLEGSLGGGWGGGGWAGGWDAPSLFGPSAGGSWMGDLTQANTFGLLAGGSGAQGAPASQQAADSPRGRAGAAAAARASRAPAAQPPPPPPRQPAAPPLTPAQRAALLVPPDGIARLCASDRPLDELLAADDAALLSRPERLRVYQHLQLEIASGWLDRMRGALRDLDTARRDLEQCYQAHDLGVLRAARVVGMTTSGVAAKQELLAGLGPKIVLVEEAAEVFEAHVLTCLAPTVEQLILIGDHLQLRPKPQSFELERFSGRGLDLDVSLFERLAAGGRVAVSTLEEQRRMHPDMLVRDALYPALRDHPSVSAHPPVKGLARRLFFLDHRNPETGADEGRSKSNLWEADFAVGLARYLIQQGYSRAGDLVIVTPYARVEASQLQVLLSERDTEELAKALKEDEEAAAGGGGGAASGSRSGPRGSTRGSPRGGQDVAGGGGGDSGGGGGGGGDGGDGDGGGGGGGGPEVASMRECLRLATVDNFQGEEAKVVILSLVRTQRDGQIGFLALDNRANVLLSRAKHGMVILGCAAALEAAAARPRRPAAVWGGAVAALRAQGLVGPELQLLCQRHGAASTVRAPEDFATLVGDGGCQAACGLALPCGHVCPRRCHSDDPDHVLLRCCKPCTRTCAQGLHACSKLCWQACGKCCQPIAEVALPCGHKAFDVPCHEAAKPESIVCREPSSVVLPCGHTMPTTCGARAALAARPGACTEPVPLRLPVCGHAVTVPCGERLRRLADPAACKEPCGRIVGGCEHTCRHACGDCVDETAAAAEAGEALLAWGRRLAERLPEAAAAWRQGFGGQPPPPLRKWREFLLELCAPPERAGAGAGAEAGARAAPVACASSLGAVEGAAPPPPLVARAAGLRELAGWLACLRDALDRDGIHHKSCKEACQKNLLCGHPCGKLCGGHKGGDGDKGCPPCSRPCRRRCPHTSCKRPCREACPPCAEPCTWACPHGACSLPCGAPCDRLPCDERCPKLLPCGHRCPGVCGEDCKRVAAFCVEPGCKRKAAARKNQVVDLIMATTFGDLAPADVDADPLIGLPCGHAFVASTLDGVAGLGDFYSRAGPGGPWTVPAPLPDGATKAPACPLCRAPVEGVRRCGRVVNKAAVDQAQLKFVETSRLERVRLEQRLRDLEAKVRGLAPSPPPGAIPAYAKALQEGLVKEAFDLSVAFWKLVEAQERPPLARVYEATTAAIRRAEAEGAASGAELAARLAAVRLKPPDPTEMFAAAQGGCSAVSQLLGALREALEGDEAALSARADRLGPQSRQQQQQQQAARQRRQDMDQAMRHALIGQQAFAQAEAQAAALEKRALATGNPNRAYRLAHVRMQLHVARVRQLQALKGERVLGVVSRGPDGAADLGEARRKLVRQQLELLGAAERIGRGAVSEHDARQAAQRAAGEGTFQHVAIREVMALLERLPELRRAAEESGLQETLALLALALGHVPDSGVAAASYLQGHVYTCPNGHVYVIGECGGAMQRGNCPECGARIGGEHHALDANNAAATAEALRRAAAPGRL
ncbi:hypothetical protein Rsub_01094 [Raphidocelis subcapitata]|uniref:RZ-type domain-containing protein n=1 Tax=Raphidocelis subcapitata TaxID=307507 RepID=A0A2V0NPC3_9CHLO|nr:hypothetical protein Rsub_01094 [Raphidocelis subcapitata]|eukprot:GBF88382.1 hypothetical protein Rsub_01094 [Raphidocelis subcapitata]